MTKSIMQERKVCYLCGKTVGLERHHIMSGIANRKLSEKYGLWVWLCHQCHTGKDGAQYRSDLSRLLKMDAQYKFEKTHSHSEWMDIFRKNYL